MRRDGHRARVVHRLVRHPRAHRTVADDGDHLAALTLHVARHRHAQRRRDRGRAVRRTERVVFAFDAPREARQAAALAQRTDALAPAGQNLVRIGLVADVPDEPIVRRVEHVMKRDGQLDHAEPGAKMAARHGYGFDQLVAKLVCDLPQLGFGQGAQIRRIANPVEQWRGAGIVIKGFATLVGHGLFPRWPPGHTSPSGAGLANGELNAILRLGCDLAGRRDAGWPERVSCL